MKCMEYSNENHINIIPKEDFQDLTREVFNVIATNISRSLGPLGSSATIFNGTIVEATKDGYSILKNYRFMNRYKKMIYNLIKAPCTRMNNTVGDGTTTAIALTNAIYKRYIENQSRLETMYRLPRQFNSAWDEVVGELIKKIKGKAKPIDPEDYDTIYNIAYVVSNGNTEISSAIAETYKTAKSPAIKMKDSPSNKSYISPVNGFEFPTNAIDVCYIRNQDLTATESDVYTIILDHVVETDEFNDVIVPINDVARAMGHKLIVIAPTYDKFMCETVLRQYVNIEYQKYHQLNLILTQYSTGKLNPHQMEDLAVVLRSKVVTQDLKDRIIARFEEEGVDRIVETILEDDTADVRRCIGRASSVLISCKNGCIFDVDDIETDEYYQEALKGAQAELDDAIAHTDYESQSYAAKIYDARSRLLQLQMKNYIYYIGADSDLQKQILQAAIEDVIKCLKSATKHGVVPGCQLAIMESCDELKNELIANSNVPNVALKAAIIELIQLACGDVYVQVLVGPNHDGIIKTIDNWQYALSSEEGAADISGQARDKITKILVESFTRGEVFDLETLDYNPNIITSAETDTMVLTAASELIKILISGNQCIFIDSDVTESHQDNVDVMV